MDYKDRKYMLQVATLVQEVYGIEVPPSKMVALEAKVSKLMRKYQLDSIKELYDHVNRHDHTALYQEFLDLVTTHKTDFFRENEHYEFLKQHMKIFIKNRKLDEVREIKVWSAACSSGEEPYTLYMVLRDLLPYNIQIRILATDISPGILRIAMRGIYNNEAVNKIETIYQKKYFKRMDHHHSVVADEVKESVVFRQFNLLNAFNFSGSFDIIFCRNVMIYFDRALQTEIVNKMYDVTAENGLLFIGMSEGLLNMKQKYKFIQPSVYTKETGLMR